MRVWEKNFLFTLSLFIGVFFIFVFIVVSTSFTSALAAERETALREEHFISQAIASDISALETRKNVSSQTLSSIAAPYGEYYQNRGIYISLTNQDAVLYSNAPIVPDINTEFQDELICGIASSEDEKYVRITDALQGTTENYTLVYLRNVNKLYDEQYRQTALLIVISVGVSVLLAFGLYITLKRIYRPIDNLAHELRTPLTAIRGYAEYLNIAAATEEERYSATKYIIDESQRLSEITEKLLIMANLREGGISSEKVDVKSLFENAKMTFKNVEYEMDQQYIKGDKALLQSMINNLVSNAIKASTDNGIVYLKAHDNIIEIIDYGIGMSENVLSKMSKPYYRANNSNKKNGAGLGLPLCYQIARLHDADIRFTSKKGEGTKVCIIFTKL